MHDAAGKRVAAGSVLAPFAGANRMIAVEAVPHAVIMRAAYTAGRSIVVASKKEPRKFGACVVKATTRLDVNHAVRALLGASKVSFASAEETKALTGMMIGGVTVFALPPDLPIYVDDKLMQREWVILGSGSRSSKIKISPEVFRRIPNATIVPGLSVDI